MATTAISGVGARRRREPRPAFTKRAEEPACRGEVCRIVVPADDPKVVLFYVESGTLTVRSTVPAVVTRGADLATPGAQAQEAIPAETEFTMRAGDATLSPAGSGGEL